MALPRFLRHLFRRPGLGFTAEDKRYRPYQVGEWTYGAPEVVYWDAGATLTIGRFCSIARGVTIFLGGEHHTEWVTAYPFAYFFPGAREFGGYPHTKGDVRIGHDVWIGEGVKILSGVTIGHGAIIGAGSVVARDVEPYAVVTGSPARVARLRFPEESVRSLLKIAWWDWPLPKIQDAWPLLLSPDIDRFIRHYEPVAAHE